MNKQYRLFFGLKFDEKSVNKIIEIKKEIIKNLQKKEIKYKEVENENIHLTLKFIGNYHDIERLKKVLEILDTKEIKNITSDEINNFHGKIIFLNIKEQKEIKLLNEQINKNLNTIESKFHAHITLFRLKQKHTLKKKLDNSISLKVKSVCLYNSKLFPAGPKYEIIREIEV